MSDPSRVAAAFVDAFNAHDEARIRELNGAQTIFEAPGDVRIEGREPATQYAMAWLNAFPDARLTVHNQLETGDWVVQEFTFEGTHQATLPTPAGDVPATNREDHQHEEGRERQDAAELHAAAVCAQQGEEPRRACEREGKRTRHEKGPGRKLIDPRGEAAHAHMEGQLPCGPSSQHRLAYDAECRARRSASIVAGSDR